MSEGILQRRRPQWHRKGLPRWGHSPSGILWFSPASPFLPDWVWVGATPDGGPHTHSGGHVTASCSAARTSTRLACCGGNQVESGQPPLPPPLLSNTAAMEEVRCHLEQEITLNYSEHMTFPPNQNGIYHSCCCIMERASLMVMSKLGSTATK